MTTHIYVVVDNVNTQATVNRLPALHKQCRSWKGPMSAVIYVALLQVNDSLPHV